MAVTKGTRKTKAKKKTGYFSEVGKIPDYKDVLVLKRFLSDRQKILHQAYTGLTAKNQRKLSTAIKKARFMGLIPYTDKHTL